MPAFTRENSSLSRRFQGALYTPFVYGGTKPWPNCAIPIGCHRPPLSTFSFSRQADSLTRFRLLTRVFARLLRPSSNSTEALWESTTVQNLIRYRPSGTYFGRFRVGGKLVRQSLETAVFSVAKQRLPDKIREYRSRHESVKAFAASKMTVGDAVDVCCNQAIQNIPMARARIIRTVSTKYCTKVGRVRQDRHRGPNAGRQDGCRRSECFEWVCPGLRLQSVVTRSRTFVYRSNRGDVGGPPAS